MAVSEGKVLRMVLSELAKDGQRYAPAGVSMRHVHVSQEDLEALFGKGAQLHPVRDLIQPGQFAAEETVTLKGPKGTLEHVRIIGPVRRETQAEVSMTDAVVIGMKQIPVRMSGHLADTPGIRIEGPRGGINLPKGIIVAARHLHLSPEQARCFKVHDGEVVSVKIGGERPCIFGNVICRTGEGHDLEFHVDTDEANACLLKNGDLVQVLLPGEDTDTLSDDLLDPAGIALRVINNLTGNNSKDAQNPYRKLEDWSKPEESILDLITEQDVNEAQRAGKKELLCTQKGLITPAARDRAGQFGIEIRKADHEASANVLINHPDIPKEEIFDLVTASDLNTAFRDDKKVLYCTNNALITPAARERIAETGIRIVRIT